MSADSSTTVEQVLEVIIRLAGGELDARLPPPESGGPIDQVAVGLNMLAEELSAAVDAEREAREALETKVEERTAELQSKLKIIDQQREAILELSTPVMRIWDDVLVLPLIGTIDEARAQQIIANLLDAIVSTGAKVAIIDVTGVPLVDTSMADHLLKTTEASRLLGTRVILTGVSAANAQAMVSLGVRLEGVTTRASLVDGLKLAISST